MNCKTCGKPIELSPDGLCGVCHITSRLEAARPDADSVRWSAWLEPLGAPCSLYRGYTLRVEVKVAGAWHVDTNWAEHEIEKALAHAEETKNDKRRKTEDVRVIRMRFEVVGSGRSGSNVRFSDSPSGSVDSTKTP